MASASNFRTSLRRHNVIYTPSTFSRTKASAKWSVTTETCSSVTSCMQIRAQFRLFQVKAMFKQHVNLIIWTWILRLQTASRNEFPCKNLALQSSWWGRESWLLCWVVFLVSCDCCVALPRGAMGLSAFCDCGISWSYSLFLKILLQEGISEPVFHVSIVYKSKKYWKAFFFCIIK